MQGSALSTIEVAHEVGANLRTVQRWVERGFVKPETAGDGSFRWAPKHRREARVLACLRQLGVSNQQLRKMVARLKALGHNPTSTGQFLVSLRHRGAGKAPRIGELLKVCEEGETLDLLRGGRVAALFPLALPEDGEVVQV